MLVEAMKRALNVDVFKDDAGGWYPAAYGTGYGGWNDWDQTIMPWAVTNTGDGLDLSPDNIYATQPSVRTVTRFRSLNAAGVPIHSFTKAETGEKNRVQGGSELDRLMQQPSPTVTGFDWVRNLMLDRDLWDRHASILRVDETGWRLDRIPPRRWRFKRDGADRPTAIQHLPKGAVDPQDAETLSLEQCFWMDDYPSCAKTPMDGIRDLLIEEHESAASRRDLWRGRARIPGVITRPIAAPPWTPASRTNLRESWQEYAARGSRTGKTPVLEDGMEYVELKMMSSVDAQQIEAKELGLRVTAAYFQTPYVLVGGDGATHSNVSAYREMVYTDALGNDFAAIDQALNARIVPRVADDPAEFLEFHVGAKLRMSFKEQADIYQKALGVPYKSVNEVRREQNLPPSSNPDHDLPIIPINVQPPDDPGAEANLD